jgi:hypothetical protein
MRFVYAGVSALPAFMREGRSLRSESRWVWCLLFTRSSECERLAVDAAWWVPDGHRPRVLGH